jgi:hypothetical protein
MQDSNVNLNLPKIKVRSKQNSRESKTKVNSTMVLQEMGYELHLKRIANIERGLNKRSVHKKDTSTTLHSKD